MSSGRAYSVGGTVGSMAVAVPRPGRTVCLGVIAVLGHDVGKPGLDQGSADLPAGIADQLIARGVQPVTGLEGSAAGRGRWSRFRDPEGSIFELNEPPPRTLLTITRRDCSALL
jgi:hypothetical protein